MFDEIETKLVKARTKLVMDKPFLGALILRLPIKSANPQWCPTTATDGRHFYYNPSYIKVLNLDQVQFVLAHEVLHCALRHFSRRQHRHQLRWDLACDYAINPLLLKEGLAPPPHLHIIEQYEGMTAEEIYPMIDENNLDEPMDKHLYDHQNQEEDSSQSTPLETLSGQNAVHDDSTALPPPPLSDREQQQLELQWQQRLAGAAQQARQVGKLSGTLARMLEHLLQPQLPWRVLLAHYMTFTAREDYTYMRPSRREGIALFPSLRSAQAQIIVALDISGSISDTDIAEFLTEMNAIKGQVRAHLTLLACDTQLTQDSPWFYEPWENFVAPKKFSGGGGTSFKPVFKYVEQTACHVDLLVYFTDAQGEFPDIPPSYPVVWLVKGKGKVPWGHHIQLNSSQ